MFKKVPESDDSRLVIDYLANLNHELRLAPRAKRVEFVSSIADHISEGQSELGLKTADILCSLGTSHDVAAEFFDSIDEPPIRNLDRATPWLLTLGGLAGLIGWGIGLYGIWTSRVWRVGDKILGSLLFPALVAAFLISVGKHQPPLCGKGLGHPACNGMLLDPVQIVLLSLVIVEFVRLVWLLYSRAA